YGCGVCQTGDRRQRPVMRRQQWDRYAEAQARTSVLITGFGPFPGVPVNATMRLLPELAEVAPRLFPDVRFAFAVLPTEWAAGPRGLRVLLAGGADSVAPHLGGYTRARRRDV